MSYINTLALEQSKFFSIFRDISLVILSSILIGLFGAIAIPLPFSPVPIATQPSLILLLSVLLGHRRAAAAVSVGGVSGEGAAGEASATGVGAASGFAAISPSAVSVGF